MDYVFSKSKSRSEESLVAGRFLSLGLSKLGRIYLFSGMVLVQIVSRQDEDLLALFSLSVEVNVREVSQTLLVDLVWGRTNRCGIRHGATSIGSHRCMGKPFEG